MVTYGEVAAEAGSRGGRAVGTPRRVGVPSLVAGGDVTGRLVPGHEREHARRCGPRVAGH